jgi:hypothetical protein
MMADHVSMDRATEGGTVGRKVLDRNPFFLLSGVLMLAGCFMINGAAHEDPGRVWPIVGLVVVFNIYEVLVIGLGLYLGRARRLYRDAAFLLMVEVLLLCDVSLAYNELFLKSLPIGVVVGACAVGLAGVKLIVIDRYLGLKITRSGVWMLSVLIGLIFVFPGLFRELTRLDLLGEGHFYAAWWVLAAAPLIAAGTQPWFAPRVSDDPQLDRLRLWITRLLIVVPMASLLLHLRAAYYVDDRSIYFYNLSPLILSLTAVWVYRRSRSAPLDQVLSVTVVTVGAAVALSGSFPDSMALALGPNDSMYFSPLRLVMIVSAVLLMYVWLWRGAWVCLPAAIGMLFTAGLGHSVSGIGARIHSAIRRGRAVSGTLLPDSITGWGVVAIVGSFIFLGIGAVTSLLARPGHVKDKSN